MKERINKSKMQTGKRLGFEYNAIKGLPQMGGDK